MIQGRMLTEKYIPQPDRFQAKECLNNLLAYIQNKIKD